MYYFWQRVKLIEFFVFEVYFPIRTQFKTEKLVWSYIITLSLVGFSPIWIPEKPIIVSFSFDKNYSIKIYKMSYRNICYLEFILRPILDPFKAILDLWVHPVSPRSDPVRLPSITFLFISSKSTKWAIETCCSSNFF